MVVVRLNGAIGIAETRTAWPTQTRVPPFLRRNGRRWHPIVTEVVATQVHFAPLPDELIDAYIATGEPLYVVTTWLADILRDPRC